MSLLSFVYNIFFWVGFISVVPYFALIIYAAYGLKEQDLKKKYSAEWGLVTGGSSGIGAAIVRKFASQNLNVVVVALENKVLADFIIAIREEFPKLQFREVSVDLSKVDTVLPAIRAATKDIKISIICNNAGFITPGGFGDLPLERQMANYNVNMTASVIITHFYMSQMLEEGRKGLFTFTSSSAGLIPNPMSALYASSKVFLTTFAASLAPEVIEDGIDVLVIHPSPINSNFYSNAGKMSALLMAQKLSSPPSVIADTITRCAGHVVVADQGAITVIMKLLLVKILDWNIFAEIMKIAIPFNGDYKALKVRRGKKGN